MSSHRSKVKNRRNKLNRIFRSFKATQCPKKTDKDDAGLSSLYIVSRVFSCCRSCFLRFAVPVLHFPFFCPILNCKNAEANVHCKTLRIFAYQSMLGIQTKGARARDSNFCSLLQSKANGKYSIYFCGTSCYRKNRNHAHFSFDSTMTAKNIQIAYWLHDVSCLAHQLQFKKTSAFMGLFPTLLLKGYVRKNKWQISIHLKFLFKYQ